MSAYKSYKGPSQSTLRGLELRCPPMPQTLVEALELMDKPEQMEVGPVTEMVQRDPVVVARLLHTVNSAYYGLRHTVGSAERAVVMLGPVAVAGIVLGMHMLKLRSILEGPAKDTFLNIIRHSIATAFLTRHLMEGQPRGKAAPVAKKRARIGTSFTSGLLHDFGKIILVYNYSQEAAALYEEGIVQQKIETTDDREMERLLFGCDHTEAGEFAARKFNFPDILIDVIRLHHEPYQDTGDPDTNRLIRTIALANLATKAMGYDISDPIAWDVCLEDPLWAFVQQKYYPHFEDPAFIVTEFHSQQAYLDEYVEHLTSATHDTFDQDMIYPMKRKLWKPN